MIVKVNNSNTTILKKIFLQYFKKNWNFKKSIVIQN